MTILNEESNRGLHESKNRHLDTPAYTVWILLAALFVIALLIWKIQNYANRRYQQAQEIRNMEHDAELEAAVEAEMLVRRLEAQQQHQGKDDLFLQKQQERRKKYVPYLKPYTMVVAESDFIRTGVGGQVQVEEEVTNDKNPIEPANEDHVHSINTEDVMAMSDDGGEGQVDLEVGNLASVLSASVALLCLPVTDDHGNLRKVDAECSICIMEYEVGDEVVWSTRRLCPHAFHSDCILLWLSKGKKRCPICRHFFVPGQRVDDKDVIVHDENDLDASRGLHNSLEQVTRERGYSSVSDFNQSDDGGETSEATLVHVRNSIHMLRSPQDMVDADMARATSVLPPILATSNE
jgi:hypothetical protein